MIAMFSPMKIKEPWKLQQSHDQFLPECFIEMAGKDFYSPSWISVFPQQLSPLFIGLSLLGIYSSHVLPFSLASCQSDANLTSTGLHLPGCGLSIFSYLLMFAFSSSIFAAK